MTNILKFLVCELLAIFVILIPIAMTKHRIQTKGELFKKQAKANGCVANGRLIKSKYRSAIGSDPQDQNRHYCVYEYYVDGVRYTLKHTFATFRLDTFSPPIDYDIYYDPKNPRKAMTDDDNPFGGKVFVLTVLLPLAIALICWWIFFR